ncbi:DNA-deoxyinosine glycosylase [Marinomonas atlantica]|uniref:DNA-deoxyinosine glycosylase n=1 Tax=Marinomonas atlantica TaxID=1806668 RepID=UPI00082C56DE|nr:DNA-deoxyinosine glycosylase [Marinomonas atlantica]MCO4786679.1 DNA-deoxyinosine glycosylase [Marinomonas atlantica]
MKPSNPLLKSFAPIVDEQATTLVLGSMPGQASLDEQQYYAHPYNLFWKIPAAVLDQPVPGAYAERVAMLKRFKVALWDVLQHCERQGSLDSKIVAGSERANDLLGLLSQYPNISKLCFNGQKAYQSFKRHLLKNNPVFFAAYELVILPSTSPANASIPKEVKFEQWQQQVWLNSVNAIL